VRGFLRAYADTLGLDGEVLVDEYRRRFEEPSAHPYPIAETSPIDRRSRPEGAGARLGGRGPLIAALLAGAVILVVVLALLATDDGGEGSGAEGQGASGPGERAAAAGERGGSAPVSLTIVASSDTEVCAVDAEGEALIDAQLLIAGTEEDLGRSRRFQVDLTDGAVDLVIDGAVKRVEAGDPVTLAITDQGARPIGYTGPECP
jgi:hypothetical protein